MGGAALAGGDAGDHLGAVRQRRFGMEAAGIAGHPLGDHLGVRVDEDRHRPLASFFIVTPAKAGIQSLHRRLKQVVPAGVGRFDLPKLPRPSPFLDLLRAPDRLIDAIMDLEPHQRLAPVATGKTFREPFTMLVCALHQDRLSHRVKRPVTTARHDVDVAAFLHVQPPSYRRRPVSSPAIGLDPGLRRGDGSIDRPKTHRSRGTRPGVPSPPRPRCADWPWPRPTA